MDLTERTITEYKKEKKLLEERRIKDVEIFADKALEELQNIIGVKCADITTVEKQLCSTSFMVDDLLFYVYKSECYYVVTMIKKCPICGTNISDRVLNLKDIGRMLVEPHNKYECDRAIGIKMDNDRNGKVLSTEERLLVALKDFVQENGCDSP